MGFFQSTTAHCEADALAHVERDNPNAESVVMIDEHEMGFGRLTMFKFEVTLTPLPIRCPDGREDCVLDADDDMYFRFCHACNCYEYDCFGTAYRADCIKGEPDYKPAHQRAREREELTCGSSS
jgi:hypothetical protein